MAELEDEGGPQEEDGMGEEFVRVKSSLKAMEFEELLEVARREMIEDIMARVRLGLASHQDLAVLRNLLKDNGMTLVPIQGSDYKEERAGSEGSGLPDDFETVFEDEGIGRA